MLPFAPHPSTVWLANVQQDRTYVPQHNKTKVYDMGLQIFRDAIARHDRVKDRLRNLLLENIRREREGQLIDRILMKSTLSMLVDLGVDGTSVYEVGDG